MTAVETTREAVVERLVDAHPTALRLARRLVRSREDAEDVAQEAFVRSLGRASSIDPSTARAYLLTAVRNTVKNQWRARAMRQRRVGDPMPNLLDEVIVRGDIDTPEDRALDVEALEEIRAVWSDVLSEKEQQTTWLHYVADLDYGELQQMLGVDAVALRQRVHRARVKLGRVHAGAARQRPSPLATTPAGVAIDVEPPPGWRRDACVDCGTSFVQQRRRGRPRVRCEECR